MTLPADQRAILDLLLVRGKDYQAIGKVLGTDAAEARARARSALAELGGGDPDAEAPLTDFLLGQADTIDRADAIRHLSQSPEANALAHRIAEALAAELPAAELPRLPDPGGRRRPMRDPRPRPAAATSPADKPAGRTSEPSRTTRQQKMIAALALGAAVLVVVVLGVAGVFSGDGEATADGQSPSGVEAGEEFVRVPLETQNGGNASGDAIIGLASNDQPYLEVDIRDLSPAPNNETYIAWFIIDGGNGYPLAPVNVDQQGVSQDRYAIPRPFVPLLTRVRAVEIALARNERVAETIETALQGNELVIERVGRVIMRGRIPREQQAPAEGLEGVDGGEQLELPAEDEAATE